MATSRKAKAGTSKTRAPVKRKPSRPKASAAKKVTKAAAGRKSSTRRKAAKAGSAPTAGKPKKAAAKARKKPAKAKPTAATKPKAGATRKPRGAASTKAKPKPKPTAATKPAPVAAKPRKPKVRKLTAADRAWQASVREALFRRRDALLSVVRSTRAEMAERTGDLADISDRASEGFEDELAVGLMAIEASQLDDIDAAIKRISDGTYGICANCEKPIARKRLEVLPFARRCLTCESNAQRFGRTYTSGYRMGDDD